MDIDEAKQAVRQMVWNRLDQAGAVAAPTAWGRIPNFIASDRAAVRLINLPQWKEAMTVKANPDKAQLPVRSQSLTDGKTLYMAVPRLAGAEPFYHFDPAELTIPASEAATSEAAASVAPMVDVDVMQHIDVIICGSVAVTTTGARLGKGAGYADIEFALLTEAGLISERTTIMTTVDDLQVVDELPEDQHDFHVDLIATPTQVIRCSHRYRPPGIDWTRLSDEKIAAIPALAARQNRQVFAEKPKSG